MLIRMRTSNPAGTTDEGRTPPLPEAYQRMRASCGHLHWWPGETPFEICVGAILTQNTNWGNVEKSIANLKREDLLAPEKLYKLSQPELAQLIRPSGYYNIKSARLRAFLKVLMEDCHGDLRQLFRGTVPEARARLLAIKGIGPETADSMLLYAGGQLSFVIDAYTRRIFSRHQWCAADVEYDDLQQFCQRHVGDGDNGLLDYWQDYHAQLVNVGKNFCKRRDPLCEQCPLRSLLSSATPAR
jgi:endonuclease-3 related protein